jgi:DNA-binding HxlR family transcriptional regulator
MSHERVEGVDSQQGSLRNVDTLHEITTSPRPSLISDILGHSKGAPSMREFEHYNPSYKRNTIQYHLNRLIEVGVVEKVALPPGQRKRDLPSTFYRLTGEGRTLLDRHNLLEEESAWTAIYENVEKPPEIEAAEEMDRPSN